MSQKNPYFSVINCLMIYHGVCLWYVCYTNINCWYIAIELHLEATIHVILTPVSSYYKYTTSDLFRCFINP